MRFHKICHKKHDSGEFITLLYFPIKIRYTWNHISAACGSSDREVINYMFRLWGKMWKDNHMLKDIVIDDDSEDTRTHKIFRALQEICYDFDLENPIWLDSNVADFKRHARTRFRQDSFIEHIEFDYLEIQVIEED